MRVGRLTARLIYWPVLAGLFFVFMPCAMLVTAAVPRGMQEPVAFFAGMTFLGWLSVGPWISYRLTPFFVSKLTCPGCREELDPVTVWHCACGFHDHRERHVLTYRCPNCRNHIGRFNCPRCDATILIW